jgi:UDP-N-acetylmuramoyl-tripeptide--D-alanyl-D-alanine ligase
MTEFQVTRAAQFAGGIVEGEGLSALITSVEIDSRRVRAGSLFIALAGTRTDGHAHVNDAFARGAVGCVVGPSAGPLSPEYADRALIRVKYPKKALADIASAHRRQLRCPVIAVTGTNGKSSTREMIAKVLAPLGTVVQSEKSFNNDLGVPLTILRADSDTVALVVEMGTNNRGEIAHLCEIAQPDVGVIINVAAAHLEGLRSEQGVAREKGALAEALPRDGTLTLNADDPRVLEMAGRTQAERVVTYSVERTTATVWGHAPERTPQGVAAWLYGKMRLELPVPGLHNVSNALAAVAVGMLQHVTAEEMRVALVDVKLPEMRMQVRSVGDVTFVLDCYNANPASLNAAVDELSARANRRRRVVVMGDMLELGLHTERLHREAGARLKGKTDVLWCVGPESKATAAAAVEAGLHPEQVFWSATTELATQDRHVQLSSGDAVLFKGSRAMGLERLANWLAEGLENGVGVDASVMGERSATARRVG